MKKLLIASLILVYFMPSVSLAADMFFTSGKSTFGKDEEFLVKVLISTKDTRVNAVGGTVVFPSESLELKEIRDGDSSVNFWVEKPHLDGESSIVFSGITAGGFSGDNNFLFSIVFKPKDIGDVSLDFNNIQVLENDGKGTPLVTQGIPSKFTISDKSSGSMPEDLTVVDNDLPEDFHLTIAKDPAVFDGKYFLVFSTVDKGSGIDHYEVCESVHESDPAVYFVAESPYLLKDQTLGSKIYVKAVDKSGNQRIVKIEPPNNLRLFLLLLIFVIILTVCLLIIRKKVRKFSAR